jgi:hypothetical protein
MPFRVRLGDLTLGANHLVVLLTVVAILVGTLIALQGMNSAGLSAIRDQIKSNTLRLDKMERDAESFRRAMEDYQREQRQNVADFAKALNDIKTDVKVDAAKRGR